MKSSPENFLRPQGRMFGGAKKKLKDPFTNVWETVRGHKALLPIAKRSKL